MTSQRMRSRQAGVSALEDSLSSAHMLTTRGAAEMLPSIPCSRDNSEPWHPDPTLDGSLGSQDGSKRLPSASGTLPGVVAAPEPSDSPGGLTHTYACSERRSEFGVTVGCQAPLQMQLLPCIWLQGGCQLAASNAGVAWQTAAALLDGCNMAPAAEVQLTSMVLAGRWRRHSSRPLALFGGVMAAMHRRQQVRCILCSLSRRAAGLAGRRSHRWAVSLQGGRGGAPPGQRPARCTSCRAPCGCRSACRRSPVSTRCGRCHCARQSTGFETQFCPVRMSNNYISAPAPSLPSF